MKCESAIDLVVDSLLDSPDDGQSAALAEHLHSCPACAAEAERVRALWTDLGQLATPPVDIGAGIRFGRGVAARERRRWLTPLLQAAAALALLLLGGAGGYRLRGGEIPVPAAPGGTSSYLLIVRGFGPNMVRPESDLVPEYAAWANRLAERGLLVGGNKLTDEPGRWISGPGTTDDRRESDVSGYFLINAANYDEAVETAQESPHIRYGGTFEIRQVDRTN